MTLQRRSPRYRTAVFPATLAAYKNRFIYFFLQTIYIYIYIYLYINIGMYLYIFLPPWTGRNSMQLRLRRQHKRLSNTNIHIYLGIYIYYKPGYIHILSYYKSTYIHIISYTCNPCIEKNPPIIVGTNLSHEILCPHHHPLSSSCCSPGTAKQVLIFKTNKAILKKLYSIVYILYSILIFYINILYSIFYRSSINIQDQ